MNLILALDQGTTSSRAILFDEKGSLVAIEQMEFQQFFPHPGWVEHDAEEIWKTQLEVAQKVLANHAIDANQIAAIGITNQRETTVVWDRRSGRPIGPAIVWQDRRTANFCDALARTNAFEDIRAKTGLVLDPYFSASKLKWILDNTPSARESAERGELAFGTIESWIIYQLSGRELHITDSSNASRTMLMNLHTGDWDETLLDLFSIPRAILPRIVPNSQIYGFTSSAHFGRPLPIASAIGDQQSALFGQTCFKHGMAKNTYGTGCFMLMNIGDQPKLSSQRLLTSNAWQIENQKSYSLEGSVFIAGAAIQWLRDGLGIIENSSDSEPLALSVPDSDGVIMVPAFAGLGAPHWDAHARGVIVGITRGTTSAHIARAALEGIAYQVADVLFAMQLDSGESIRELRVDGGASVNNFLMQFQADILQTHVIRPKIVETTALGAAYLAGLATGLWKSLSEIESLWKVDREFHPVMSDDEASHRYSLWQNALSRAKGWDQQSKSK